MSGGWGKNADGGWGKNADGEWIAGQTQHKVGDNVVY